MALGELEELHLTSTRQELEEALLKNEFGPITSSYYLIIEYFNRIKPDSPTFFGKVHHESTNSEVFLFLFSFFSFFFFFKMTVEDLLYESILIFFPTK